MSPVRLTWIGHSTVGIEIGGLRMITDPILREHLGPLRRRGPMPDANDWLEPDVVLLSHLHMDHADVGSLRRIDPRTVITGEANARWVRRKLETATVSPGEHWTELAGGNVEVRLVRADHRHRPMPHRPNDAHGMLLRAEGATIWFAGDTSLYDEMADLPDIADAEIDLALLPIGGWGPRLSPGHMDGWQAAQAARKVGAHAVLPIHWGTFAPVRMAGPWMDRPAVHLEDELGELTEGTRLILPTPGEVIELGSG